MPSRSEASSSVWSSYATQVAVSARGRARAGGRCGEVEGARLLPKPAVGAVQAVRNPRGASATGGAAAATAWPGSGTNTSWRLHLPDAASSALSARAAGSGAAVWPAPPAGPSASSPTPSSSSSQPPRSARGGNSAHEIARDNALASSDSRADAIRATAAPASVHIQQADAEAASAAPPPPPPPPSPPRRRPRRRPCASDRREGARGVAHAGSRRRLAARRDSRRGLGHRARRQARRGRRGASSAPIQSRRNIAAPTASSAPGVAAKALQPKVVDEAIRRDRVRRGGTRLTDSVSPVCASSSIATSRRTMENWLPAASPSDSADSAARRWPMRTRLPPDVHFAFTFSRRAGATPRALTRCVVIARRSLEPRNPNARGDTPAALASSWSASVVDRFSLHNTKCTYSEVSGSGGSDGSASSRTTAPVHRGGNPPGWQARICAGAIVGGTPRCWRRARLTRRCRRGCACRAVRRRVRRRVRHACGVACGAQTGSLRNCSTSRSAGPRRWPVTSLSC